MTFEAQLAKRSNWGKWGADDEKGALNLITPEKRREGASAVIAGETVSCALELAVLPSVENPSPALHMMIQAGDDCLIPGVGFEADFSQKASMRCSSSGNSAARAVPRQPSAPLASTCTGST